MIWYDMHKNIQTFMKPKKVKSIDVNLLTAVKLKTNFMFM